MSCGLKCLNHKLAFCKVSEVAVTEQCRLMNVNFVVSEVPEHVSAPCRFTDKKWQPCRMAARDASNCRKMNPECELRVGHVVREGPVTQDSLNNMALV